MNGKRILIVDDGITVRMFCRNVLEQAGFTVEEAANGIEGVERALGQAFDLLVVDINMPKMDGYQMIRHIRDEPALAAVPVMTISTEARDDDIARAYQAGANFYMTKPVRPAELVQTARLLTGVRAP
jgi:two-component system, chemotaxis family, chemotaxis protein CheY